MQRITMIQRCEPPRNLLAGGPVALLALMIAGCGGSGAPITSTPPPAPAPSVTPTPTPAPAPGGTFDTAEYRRSSGPQQHGATVAWQAGRTGAGQTIAIVDSGIDATSPEFAGRILAASRDVANGGRTIQAEDDHGTNVALVAAAARNDSGVMGIAFDAPLLVLRADQPGSCKTTGGTTSESTCSFFDSAIARGVDAAVSAGARVVNLSLGGKDGIDAGLRDAIARASAAGVVVVVAAGNGGDGSRAGVDPNQPTSFASQIRAAGGTNVIIVGSVDEANSLSSFSQRAGSQSAWYLTARGERVCCVYKDGQIFVGRDASGAFNLLFSGTSFAAPQVAGAVALLAQAFPNLTGQQIVRLLLDSARDAGASGVDAVYGAGVLDIAAAMAPRGTMTLAGTTSVLALGSPGATSSPAMGDALANTGAIAGIALDGYARAYTVDLGAGLRAAPLQGRLGGIVGGGRHVTGLAGKSLSLAFTVAADEPGQSTGWSRELRLSGEQASEARLLAARAIARIAPGTQLAFGLREGAQGLAAQLEGARQPAFLVTEDARRDSGFRRLANTGFAVRHRLGATGVTMAAETGEVLDPTFRSVGISPRAPERVRSLTVSADRRFGALDASLAVSMQDEASTVLGGRFASAFGGSGASTLFLDAALSLPMAGGWHLGGSWRQGWTQLQAAGAVTGASALNSSCWSVDLSRQDLFARGDSFGLRIAQPLRVTGGGLALNLPVAYDYATLLPTYATRIVSLAPSGREIDGEIAWSGPLWGGQAFASLFYRKDPGHYAAVPDDKGVAIRWAIGF